MSVVSNVSFDLAEIPIFGVSAYFFIKLCYVS